MHCLFLCVRRGNIICNLLCTYAILSPWSQKLFLLLFFCMVLIPISLYNLLPNAERRNSSLFCFSQLLSCLEGWLKIEKCICVHANSARFAFFIQATMLFFLPSSFAINSMTKQKMLLLYTVCANTSVPVVSFIELGPVSRCWLGSGVAPDTVVNMLSSGL